MRWRGARVADLSRQPSQAQDEFVNADTVIRLLLEQDPGARILEVRPEAVDEVFPAQAGGGPGSAEASPQ